MMPLMEGDERDTNRDALASIAEWPRPKITRSLALAMFRTWVVTPAVDLELARALTAGLGCDGDTVSRLEGSPCS